MILILTLALNEKKMKPFFGEALSWMKCVFSAWLDGDLSHREQKRQRHTLGLVVSIFHGSYAIERKTMRGRLIMASFPAVA